MSTKAEPKNWEEYMKAHLTDIPEGKENEYVAKVLVGYKNRNMDPPVPFSKKKAEKDASSLMKNKIFQEQMSENRAEMLAMMAAGQYDAMVRQTVSPVPVLKNNLKPAYEGLEKVQGKIANGTYSFPANKEWNLLCSQIDQSVAAKKEDPEMSEAMQIVNLLKVYTAYKDYEATVPKNSPEHKGMAGFGFELLTALGGGPEATQKRLSEHFADAERELREIENDVNEEFARKHPNLVSPAEGPVM